MSYELIDKLELVKQGAGIRSQDAGARNHANATISYSRLALKGELAGVDALS